MRRQSMQEYQGISILFFSRQSKAWDQHLVFLKSKQSTFGQDKLDSKMVDKSVDQERETQCKAEIFKIKETSSAQCTVGLKSRRPHAPRGPTVPLQYAPPPVRRGPGTVAGWTAGEVAELVRYVKWAGKTRGGGEKRGTRPFSDLIGRTGRPREREPEMDEGRWRRMLGEAPPGVSPNCPQEKGKKPRVRMLRELLQREGRYGGDT